MNLLTFLLALVRQVDRNILPKKQRKKTNVPSHARIFPSCAETIWKGGTEYTLRDHQYPYVDMKETAHYLRKRKTQVSTLRDISKLCSGSRKILFYLDVHSSDIRRNRAKLTIWNLRYRYMLSRTQEIRSIKPPPALPQRTLYAAYDCLWSK